MQLPHSLKWHGHVWLLGIAMAVLLIGIVTVGGSFYLLNFALTPEQRTMQRQWTKNYERFPWLRSWFDSIRQADCLQDTTIVLPTRLRSHAYYLRGRKGAIAVLIHGYKEDGLDLVPTAYIYNKVMGYSVLLPDLHAHGKSEGSAIQMGWLDRKDVEAWLPVAQKMFGKRGKQPLPMVLQGVSMGAATTMNVAGDSLPAYVRCFVEDCGYTSAWDEFSYELSEMFGLPEIPLMYSSSGLCKLRYGWTFGEASPLRQVSRCRKPMLFIHGGTDTFVPTPMVYTLFAAKPQPKELWVAPGSGHADSYRLHPEEYIEKVKTFVERNIKPQ